MATYDLRRFAHADSLKAIGVQHLLALLNPYKPYFDGRGLMLPSSLLRQVVLLVSVSMLLYTDGVTEAMNEKRELYDEVVPLKRFAIENRERPSSKGLSILWSLMSSDSPGLPRKRTTSPPFIFVGDNVLRSVFVDLRTFSQVLQVPARPLSVTFGRRGFGLRLYEPIGS
jgi:hypothetical protein